MPKLLITGTQADDLITGQQVAEEIHGQDGNDVISGNGGDDDIYGEAGDDTLVGGAGNDLLSGGAGVDTTVFSGNFRDYNFVNMPADGALSVIHARGTHANGADTVQSDVEYLRFADRTIDLRVNNAPETVNDALTTNEDARLLNVASVLKNDMDVEAMLGRQSIAVTAVNGDTAGLGAALTLASGAKLTMHADGTYDYDPGALGRLAAGESYHDSFVYTVTDSAGASSTASVDITVAGRNDAPVAAGQSVEIHADAQAVSALFSADDIDSDDSQGTLTYQIVSGPLEGSVSIAGNSFVFAPETAFQDLGEGEARDVTFAYRAVDQHGAASNAASVTVTVTGVNDSPVVTNGAVNGSVTESAAPDHQANGSISFADPDTNDQHAITVTPAGEHYLGTFTTDTADGPGGGAVNWNFSVAEADIDGLAGGQSLTQTYEVGISDGHTSTTQAVSVTIVGANDAPEFVSGDGAFQFSITEDKPAGTYLGQTLATDVDSASVSYAIVGGTGAGLFAIDPKGQITAAQPLDYEAQSHYTLDVQARDDGGALSIAHVNVSVLDREAIIYNMVPDRQTHTIEQWESNDHVRIDRLSTDMSLQYAEVPGVLLDFATARTAANLVQVGVPDVGVAYYLNGSGGLNAVVAIDEDSFGTTADMWLDIHNVHPGQIGASNFEFV